MANRLFLMKGHDLDYMYKVAGSWLSQKFDGMRCVWLPRTRGVKVPWNEKIGTGFWTNYGNPIFAPKWFLDGLPQIPLDGELWAGRGNFNKVSSACRKHEAIDEEWERISYQILDTPSYMEIFRPGLVKGKHFTYHFPLTGLIKAFGSDDPKLLYPKRFSQNYDRLMKITFPEHVMVAPQKQLDFSTEPATEQLNEIFDDTVSNGGEGVILRQPYSEWKPEKSREIAKVKPERDMEGTIVGFKDGKGKYEDLLGSLELQLEGGAIVNLSGMSDEARLPGYFKIGEIIRFKYTELTEKGIPRHLRYERKFNDHQAAVSVPVEADT